MLKFTLQKTIFHHRIMKRKVSWKGTDCAYYHLVYAILDPNDDTTTVQVKNFASGETNELFHKGTSGSGAGDAVFTADGTFQ